MNYQILKNLVDSLTQNFRCVECQSWVNLSNIEIIWVAWNSINLEVECLSCHKHTFIKAQANHINLWDIAELKSMDPIILKEKLKEKLKNKNTQIDITNSNNSTWIQETQILELREMLKNKNINVEDFLWKN